MCFVCCYDVVSDRGTVVDRILGEDNGGSTFNAVVVRVTIIVCAGHGSHSSYDRGQNVEELEIQVTVK